MGGIPERPRTIVKGYGTLCARCLWLLLSIIRQAAIDRGEWVIPEPGESYHDAAVRQGLEN